MIQDYPDEWIEQAVAGLHGLGKAARAKLVAQMIAIRETARVEPVRSAPGLRPSTDAEIRAALSLRAANLAGNYRKSGHHMPLTTIRTRIRRGTHGPS